jgi:divalent metal cation (Fe/Co/Zn/Cd) transporter
MKRKSDLTGEQRAREGSILFALVADSVILAAIFATGILGGSLTLVAESIRGSLILSIEFFSYAVMRRVHRESLFDMEFGSGKLEQIANLAIAGGMLIGGLWVLYGVFEIVVGHKELGSPLGLTFAAIVAAINTALNIVSWDVVRRAAKAGKSIIMQAQLRSRYVRVFSSIFIQTTMTIAAVSTDAVVATWAEAIGSAFVACFILSNGIDMFRSGLPDILDRSAEEELQIAINRALARHFHEYDMLGRVRTRRSGHTVFIEIALGYNATLTMDEVGRRIDALKSSLGAEIDSADITIVPWAEAA